MQETDSMYSRTHWWADVLRVGEYPDIGKRSQDTGISFSCETVTRLFHNLTKKCHWRLLTVHGSVLYCKLWNKCTQHVGEVGIVLQHWVSGVKKTTKQPWWYRRHYSRELALEHYWTASCTVLWRIAPQSSEMHWIPRTARLVFTNADRCRLCKSTSWVFLQLPHKSLMTRNIWKP